MKYLAILFILLLSGCSVVTYNCVCNKNVVKATCKNSDAPDATKVACIEIEKWQKVCADLCEQSKIK